MAEEIILRMKDIEKRRRTARIRAALALIYRDGERVHETVAEDAIEGIIAPRAYPEIRAGFPYRAVLWLPELSCYLGELGEKEEARLGQRKKALQKLRAEIERLASMGRDSLA